MLHFYRYKVVPYGPRPRPLLESLSRLFALVREADFLVPFQPGKSHHASAQPVLQPDSLAGSELMTLSESVLASFAPHLQLLLNPQAKVLSGKSPDRCAGQCVTAC